MKVDSLMWQSHFESWFRIWCLWWCILLRHPGGRIFFQRYRAFVVCGIRDIGICTAVRIHCACGIFLCVSWHIRNTLLIRTIRCPVMFFLSEAVRLFVIQCILLAGENINSCKNDINKIAVKHSTYAIVAQWQSTSLVMKRSGVQFPSIACASNDENKRKTIRIKEKLLHNHKTNPLVPSSS